MSRALAEGSALHLTISAAQMALAHRMLRLERRMSLLALLRVVVWVAVRLNVRNGSLLALTSAVYV